MQIEREAQPITSIWNYTYLHALYMYYSDCDEYTGIGSERIAKWLWQHVWYMVS